MTLKALLTVNSILAFVSGAACILVPVQLLAQYDVTLSPMGLVVYQFWGAALVGLGMLVWAARAIADRLLQKRISLALFVTHALSWWCCSPSLRWHTALSLLRNHRKQQRIIGVRPNTSFRQTRVRGGRGPGPLNSKR